MPWQYNLSDRSTDWNVTDCITTDRDGDIPTGPTEHRQVEIFFKAEGNLDFLRSERLGDLILWLHSSPQCLFPAPTSSSPCHLLPRVCCPHQHLHHLHHSRYLRLDTLHLATQLIPVIFRLPNHRPTSPPLCELSKGHSMC
jgi:hypothetical protein